MKKPWKVQAAIPALLGALLACGAAIAETPPGAPAGSATDVGAWQKHQYTFAYMGFTSTYSCDGLADQLKRLLLAAGARPDVTAQPGACASSFGRPDRFARADLTFYTLAPNVAGNAPSDAPPVAGVWRPVKLQDHMPRQLALGDCELVEQFRDHVLPMFATRHIDDRMTCIPFQLSGSVINLNFESFIAAPRTASAR